MVLCGVAAETALAGWRAREAKSGRTYECGSQSISGFPFRIEVRCTEPSAELRGKGTQLVLKGADLVMLAQIYQPTLLIGEFKSPMTVAEPGTAAGLCRELDARPVEHARHAARAATRLAGVRQSQGAAHRQRRDGPQRQADGAAWPHGGRLGQRQSGDRCRLARDRRHRARGASDHRRRRSTPMCPRPCAGLPTSRRSRGRRVSGNCRRATAASTSPMRVSSRAT